MVAVAWPHSAYQALFAGEGAAGLGFEDYGEAPLELEHFQSVPSRRYS